MINSYSKQIAKVMNNHKRIVVITGAGISAASGLPVYRDGGNNKTWRGKGYEDIVTADVDKSSKDFIEYVREFQDMVASHNPNKCHDIIASWIHSGKVAKVLTQNVDGYHGRKGVIELHGNINQMYCEKCGKRVRKEYYHNVSHKCNSMDFSFENGYEECRGIVRPDITLFGEDPKNLDAAILQIYLADLVMVLGTSLSVSPVKLLPAMAKKNGSTVVVINKDPITSIPEEYIDYAMYGEELVSTLQDIDYQLQCLADKNGKSRC